MYSQQILIRTLIQYIYLNFWYMYMYYIHIIYILYVEIKFWLDIWFVRSASRRKHTYGISIYTQRERERGVWKPISSVFRSIKTVGYLVRQRETPGFELAGRSTPRHLLTLTNGETATSFRRGAGLHGELALPNFPSVVSISLMYKAKPKRYKDILCLNKIYRRCLYALI